MVLYLINDANKLSYAYVQRHAPQKLLRFPTKKGMLRTKPYLTRLSIDEHNLYYEGRDRVSLLEAARRGILLYDLK